MAERRSKRNIRKSAEIIQLESQKEAKAHTKKVGDILKKSACERTEDEKKVLKNSSGVIKTLEQRARTREKQKQRIQECEDNHEVLQAKCKKLAQEILNCRYVIVYTGAGISTAASIPDYRGPNGVWTLLKKGIEPGAVDLSDADPTYTHMSVSHLYSKGLVKYVVSQNCDGLHMRSGLPRNALSELHGDMFIEICLKCSPVQEHLRLFDTTERTGLRRHKTGRQCDVCGGDLKDSIVHFGEKGPFHSPYNWKEASKVADRADLILCLGSSLKVLRRYPCLWNMQKPVKERAKLVIVNLQWTPKDDLSFLKINGKCDDVMRIVMQHLSLSVPKYDRDLDPIYAYAVPLKPAEVHTVGKRILVEPPEYEKDTVLRIMKTLAKMRVNINFSSDEDSEETEENFQNHTDAENPDVTRREVIAMTRRSNDTRTGTGKATARKSPCKLGVVSSTNGECKGEEDMDELCPPEDTEKCANSIGVNHVNECNSGCVQQEVRNIKKDDTVAEVSRRNGLTPVNSRTATALRTMGHCIKKLELNMEKTLLEKCLGVEQCKRKDQKLKNKCTVVLDRNVVDDYMFQNAQENLNPSGNVKARVLHVQALKQSGQTVPRCKSIGKCAERKEPIENVTKNIVSPVSPGSASRRKRSRPSRSKSTEGPGEDHSLEKKLKRDDLDILGNDIFSMLDDSESDDSLSSAIIEVSIPSIFQPAGRKCRTISSSTDRQHTSKPYGVGNQNLSTDMGSINSRTTAHYEARPRTSKDDSAGLSSGLNIPGDQALSFLAMEEACELPDLTLDSRKVWASYSSWFTALYQSLELKRDETGSHSGTIQVNPRSIHDPDVVSTAKEQNTVLLANLAVHDLEAEQSPEQQDWLRSGLSSPEGQYMAGSLVYTAGGISPFHSLDSSAGQSPRAGGGSMRIAHRSPTSSSQGRDSVSVCSSMASPREYQPQGCGSESLRQPVFAESQPTTISFSEPSNQSGSSAKAQIEDLQCSTTADVSNTIGNATSSTCAASPSSPLDHIPPYNARDDTTPSTLVRPDNITSPPIVITPAAADNPPIVISPMPVIDILNLGLSTEENHSSEKQTRGQSSLEFPISPATGQSRAAVKRRNSVPPTMMASQTPTQLHTLSTGESSALFAFPEGATGRGPYRPRGRPPNKPGSPVHDPNDAISRIVQTHIKNIKEKTATIVETKDQVLKTMGSSAPGWFGKGCRIGKRRKNSR